MEETRDPATFTFTDEENNEISQKLDNVRSELTNIDMNLKTDDIELDGQKFALISIVSPDSNQKSSKCCVKIKGVFNTEEEARKHVKLLIDNDPTYDIFIVSMYEWLLVPPNMDHIEDQEYIDKELNEMISDFRVQQKKSALEFEKRKDILSKKKDVNLNDIQEDMNVKKLIEQEEGIIETKDSEPEEKKEISVDDIITSLDKA